MDRHGGDDDRHQRDRREVLDAVEGQVLVERLVDDVRVHETELPRLAEDILQRNPDLDLFYGVDDTVGVGAAQAVKQGPGCDSVQIVTAILGPTAEELLREGCIDYLVAQQTVNIGRDSVATLVRAIEGGSVEENVDVPNVVVTPDTIESLDKSGIQPPEGWRPDVR